MARLRHARPKPRPAARRSIGFMQDSLVLHPSKTGNWLLLVFYSGGVLAGLALVLNGRLPGLIVMAGFGLFAAVTIAELWPGRVYLRLSPAGFEVRSLRHHFAVNWSDVDSFVVTRIGVRRYVGMRLTDAARAQLSDPDRVFPEDVHGNLPFRSGFDVNELAERMNEWKRRASGPT